MLYRRIISSFKEVPPVVTIHCTPMCFPISLTIADVWRASSLVGIRIKTEGNQIGKKGEELRRVLEKIVVHQQFGE